MEHSHRRNRRGIEDQENGLSETHRIRYKELQERLMSTLQEDVVRENLRTVNDPELGVNIVDLGLIYGIEIEGSKVTIKMTLTSPACPLGSVIQAQAHQAITKLPWAKEVKIDLVWSPRWDPRQMASEDVKMELGIL